MRSVAHVGRTEARADELLDPTDDAELLGELAHDGLLRGLVRIDPPGDESPPAVVGAPDEQDASVVVEHGAVGTDLRGHVSGLGEEAGADDVRIRAR